MAAIFEGENGGATSRGVTGAEILVSVPNRSTAGMNDQMRLLFDYFNLHYEFYGRRLTPVFMPYSNSTPMDSRATADQIAAAGAFAALDYNIDSTTPSPWFHSALARNKVVTIAGRDIPYGDRTVFDEGHPYIWGVNPSLDQIWSSTAELVCSALKDRPAAHAGSGLRGTTRKFGVIVARQVNPSVPLTLEPKLLVDGMESCGAPVAVAEVEQMASDQLRAAFERLRSAGVTTLACVCNAGTTQLPSALQAITDWQPEVLLPNFMYNMEAIERNLQGASVSAVASRIFGVHQQAKLLPYQARPFFSAMLEVNAGFKYASGGGDYNYFELEGTYRQLLLLASGIQGAGPALTADNFAAALMSTQFPNPGAGQAPFWQAPVGFGPGDHTMNNGVALAWWNPSIETTSVVSTPGARGAWCFLGGGTRFGPGEIPKDADSRFFAPNEPCR